MKRIYELVVFDWDGTLMDSTAKIVSCFSAAAADVGAANPGDDAIRNIIGLGLNEAIMALFPEYGQETCLALVERYRQHFLHIDDTETALFPGVKEGVAELMERGYLLAIATGKARRGLERVLWETDMAHFFTATRCADEACSKPHPKMLEDILAQTGVAAGSAVMVGDTIYDMQMAGNAGVASIAVSYGVHDCANLTIHGPLACLDTFEEICRWLHQGGEAALSAPAKH